MDQAIGRMTKHSSWAADAIAAIAKDAELDSVRLGALRALFSDTIAVSKYTGLEARMTEIEEQLLQRADDASSTGASPPPSKKGPSATPAKT